MVRHLHGRHRGDPGLLDRLPNAPYWLNALFGFFAIVVSLQGQQPTVPLRLQALVERFRRPSRLSVGSAGAVPPRTVAAGHGGLVVDNLRVRFGGLVAVDELSFTVQPGRITGLIGPNGAGKTTTFDACSGLNRRVGGKISIHDRDVTRLGPAARGRLGLGRTFQRMQLGDSLTVAENVALGREAGLAGALPWSQMFASPTQRRETVQATAHALELCGIADLAEVQAGALSTGQRRLVELARCLAGDFDILMLDEPSSGLDHRETAAFAEVLLRVVEERGCGILLVEHDVALVMSICAVHVRPRLRQTDLRGHARRGCCQPDRAGGVSRLHRRDLHRGAGGDAVSAANCDRGTAPHGPRPTPSSRSRG